MRATLFALAVAATASGEAPSLPYWHHCVDGAGASRFVECSIDNLATSELPGTGLPLFMGDLAPPDGSSMESLLVVVPPGARSLPHRNPFVQLVFIQAGELTWMVSDGTNRTLRAGEIYFGEDQLGDLEHFSENRGDTDTVLRAIQFVDLPASRDRPCWFGKVAPATAGGASKTTLTPSAAPTVSAKKSLSYMHNYVGDDGRSHFMECTFSNFSQEEPSASGVPTFHEPLVAPDGSAMASKLLVLPPGWKGAAHPDPVVQFVFFLAGEGTWTTSDGTSHHFRAGDVFLGEDQLADRGHVSENTGEGDMVVQLVQFPDLPPSRGQPCWYDGSASLLAAPLLV